MKNIDQHSAVVSLEKALVPSKNLIDGRTERDLLCFLSDFASVINFYNNENKISGNWVPFLLKDPVFLLAQISNTRFHEIHERYKSICHKLEQVLVYKTTKDDLSTSMNQLFDLLTDLFMRIERWTVHMQNSSETYNLKEYVINQITQKYSSVFWAMLSLRQNLVYTKEVGNINNVKYYLFESFDELIWKQSRGLTPFWEVLSINITLKADERNPIISPLDCYNALKTLATDLFNFFYTSIQHAALEFETQKTKTTNYPDTILLRTFINLLGVHQEQLNNISHKHLHFYYKDILKQKALPALADTVYICADLSKPTAAFNLLPGVLFNAGLDDQKNPILFSTTEAVELNPATISNVYTLAAISDSNKLVSLHKTAISNTGSVNKDAAGNIIGWETFGGTVSDPDTTPKLGFAFASPLLLLREGCRKIKIYFSYDTDVESPIDPKMFSKASFFLSTKAGWLNLSLSKPIGSSCFTLGEEMEVMLLKQHTNPFGIEINLDMTHPPIESFLLNPDGLTADWPMFKIEFPFLKSLEKPPVLASISIEVSVANLKNLQLYNDYGALSTKTPYQLFGPTPLVNSNFIIGSNEIFTKPLTHFVAELSWDKLPDNFITYYQQYNLYLAKNGKLEVAKEEKEIQKIENSLKNTIIKIVNAIIAPFKRLFPKTKIVADVDSSLSPFFEKVETKEAMALFLPFSNTCFTVGFQALKNNSWLPFNLINKKDTTPIDPKATGVSDVEKQKEPQKLFNSPLNTPGVISQTLFMNSDPGKYINPFPCDPAIQNTPLKYTDTSSDGFIKMGLNGPSLGFGSELYPKVVSYYAMANAYNISHSKDSDFEPISLCASPDPSGDSTKSKTQNLVICPPPNLPFAPKLDGLSISYTASHTYILKGEKESTSTSQSNNTKDYPIQCFLYSMFANYMVYDNTKKEKDYENNYLTSIVGTEKTEVGVPLFSAFKDDGAVFIALQNLVEGEKLHIFFELKKAPEQNISKDEIGYYYLSDTGWKDLEIFSDTTDCFSCSGILSIVIPKDITTTSTNMGEQKFWLSFTVKNNAKSFAQTLFLKTNGFVVSRTGTTFLTNYQAPVLAANSITKPQNPIPEIASVVQPFNSFGGKGAETKTQMNQRVSNRMKTKDRAISAEDYYRLVKQEFNDVYYSKSILNQRTKRVETYIVPAFQSSVEAGAFHPVLSGCKGNKIYDFLSTRVSSFCRLQVSNFKFQFVKITAVVAFKKGYEKVGMQKKINDGLNLYLSPWIKSSSKQIEIDTEITASQAAEYVSRIDGVAEVQCLGFETWLADETETTSDASEYQQTCEADESKDQNNKITCDSTVLNQTIKPFSPNALLISYMNHTINCIPS